LDCCVFIACPRDALLVDVSVNWEPIVPKLKLSPQSEAWVELLGSRGSSAPYVAELTVALKVTIKVTTTGLIASLVTLLNFTVAVTPVSLAFNAL
jgi:hypothetical protein